MLDSKIQQLKYHFGITKIEDWRDVYPAWITNQEGIGDATLNYIRLILANRGLTLKDDRTPEYWREHLEKVKISHSLGDDDTAKVCPFTILIDSAEQEPFTFQGLTDSDGNQVIVKTEWRSLGRFPHSLGDYSMDGFVNRIHFERKSLADFQATVLGFDGRRDRFEAEVAALKALPCGRVIVEATEEACWNTPVPWSKKPEGTVRKMLSRTINALQMDYGNLIFCGNRRIAETKVFRMCERFWRKNNQAAKDLEKLVATM